MLWVAGHSGPETAEDSRTHFGIYEPYVTQLFPDMQVVDLHPWEHNEVPVVLGAALRLPVPIVALHLTRPPVTIPDREALGIASHFEAARGAYVLRAYREGRPRMVTVFVQGTATTTNASAESAIVADRVERKLKEFLHPITGRKERTGWEFGQDVFISEIAAEIEDVEGINYITELTLKKKDKFLQEASIGRNMLITIEDNELPSAGNIKVSSEKVINAAAITGFGQ